MTEVTHWSFPTEMQPVPSELTFDLDRALQSVVRLSSHIPEDGYTASMLGTERTGNGVVIREDGLIVTIGYLITEAESIWITTHDNRAVQGHPLAYDFATGMGLVLPLGPLNAAHVSLRERGQGRGRRRGVRRRPRRARPRAQGRDLRAPRVRGLLGIPARRRAVHVAAAPGVERRRVARPRGPPDRHRLAVRAGGGWRRSEEGQHVRADRRPAADPRRHGQDRTRRKAAAAVARHVRERGQPAHRRRRPRARAGPRSRRAFARATSSSRWADSGSARSRSSSGPCGTSARRAA